MKNTKYGITGLILIALLAGGVFVVRKMNPTAPLAALQNDQKTKGPADAPVQMVEYSDFQCPACQKAGGILQKILSNPEYDGKIHLVFRHYPLPNHRWAGLAHQAAECAHEQGHFWDYHDKLYAEQAIWSALESPMETFLRYAKELGMPLESFGLCLASPETRQHVLDDQKKGDGMQISSTPTFFINGERLVGPMELLMNGEARIRSILKLPALVPAASPSPAASPAPSVSPAPQAAV